MLDATTEQGIYTVDIAVHKATIIGFVVIKYRYRNASTYGD